MPTCYQIPNWDTYFENHKSRVIDVKSWTSMPNKQHGMGLTYILTLPDGAMIYGIWCLIVGACSQQRKDRLGWLTDDGSEGGTPWTPLQLSVRWRRPVEELERALEVLTSPEVKWMVSNKCPPSALQPRLKGRRMEGGKDGGKDTLSAVADGFSRFWSTWPKHFRKQGKTKCLAIWRKQNLEPFADKVIDALERCKASRDWTKSGGQFVPFPQTWLNRTPWETDPADMVERPAEPEPDDTGFQRTLDGDAVVSLCNELLGGAK